MKSCNFVYSYLFGGDGLEEYFILDFDYDEKRLMVFRRWIYILVDINIK